jgi:hypothetical protein
VLKQSERVSKYHHFICVQHKCICLHLSAVRRRRLAVVVVVALYAACNGNNRRKKKNPKAK